MTKAMKSRERMLAAMSRQEVDHVPCCFELEFSPTIAGYTYRDQFERVGVMQKLGIDPFIQVEPCWIGHTDKTRKKYPIRMHPDVKVRVWEEKGGNYPLLCKEYTTPAGKLSCSVQKSEDWPYGNDIPIFSDFNTPRYVKPLVLEKEDVEKLPYLFLMPGEEEKQEWRKNVSEIKSKISTDEVILKGYCGSGMDPLMWMCGSENAIMLVMEKPELARRILEITHNYEMAYQKLLAEAGVDYIERRGWYETVDFWSPKIYE
jgi:hypothetical protein